MSAVFTAKAIGQALLLSTVSALALGVSLSHGQSLPTGGSVTHGEASISPSGSSLLVTQSSHNAILSWDSFSIGSGASAHFANGSGATLNRVTGHLPSTIDGRLTATGSLYLINPTGVVVGTGGMVRTGGSFVASTHEVSDADFLARADMVFSGTSRAGIVNEGVIAALGGDVVLTARRVENTGTILAPQGDVGLLAGYEILLRDLGSDEGRFAVRIGGSDTEVINSGTLQAVNAELRANGGSIHALAGNTNGVISATGMRNTGGRIFLTAGTGGSVTASQRIVARPAPPQATPPSSAPVPQNRPVALGGAIRIAADRVTLGGEIDVSGDSLPGGTIIAVAKHQLELTAGARLDASGATGGLILLGGDWQGGSHAESRLLDTDIGTTQTTLIGAGATLRADGTVGAGGTVVVWGDDHTGFAGHISATGVTRGGNAEVSGKTTLAYAGMADLRASDGAFGTLLLDPYNITIAAGTHGLVTGDGFTATGNNSLLGATTLLAALDYANVIVSTGTAGDGGGQAGNITVNAALGWHTNATLTLQAVAGITLNEAITARAGGLTLDAGGLITTGAGGTVEVARFTLAKGGWTQNTAILPGFATGDFRINGGSFLRVAGGGGTGDNPYQLADIYGVQGINSNASFRAASWSLANDIDASGTLHWHDGAGFVPIGTTNKANSFSGNFNGQGHVIAGLTIARPILADVGLFGQTWEAKITNVGLENAAIMGHKYVGGLVGYQRGGLIERGYVTGAIASANSHAGGLVGFLYEGGIDQSHSTATVDGQTDIGGLVGHVTGGRVTQSYATGAVTGFDNIGGLVGLLEAEGLGQSIGQSYATGRVQSTSTSGSVAQVGGLVGQQQGGLIMQSYATGAVSGGTRRGGLVGFQFFGDVESSYWDINTTGQTNGRGTNPPRPKFIAVGLTTAEFRNTSPDSSRWLTTLAVAAGWDFDTVWYQAGDMRPILRSSAGPVIGGVTQISSLMQLQLMGANLSGSYALTSNIDASATNAAAGSYNPAGIWGTGGFVPVGTRSNEFSGNLNGRGHVISGLTINRPTQFHVGLFGRTSGAMIAEIGLDGGAVTGGLAVGALVGSHQDGSISQSWASGAVSGSTGVGGLVGSQNLGSISQSWASGAVTGDTFVGGLVGNQSRGSISESWASGAVRGTYDRVGGLVGVQADGSISRSWASGTVTGSSSVGGLVGEKVRGSVTASYWDMNTTGIGYSAGEGVGAAVGLTTAEFRNTSLDSSRWLTTLAAADGWDFDNVWYQADDMRPILRSSAGPVIGGVTQISSLMQLQLMGANLSGSYALTSNIDASATDASLPGYSASGIWGAGGFVPVGTDFPNSFTGSLDGQGHVISALTIDREAQRYAGLFGRTQNATFANVGLEGGTVSGSTYVGGLVGWQTGGSITQSWASGNVTGRANDIGGLVGLLNGGSITQSWASGNVTGYVYVGGLVGRSGGGITQSWASGNVTGSSNAVGGLIGLLSVGSITQSRANGNVTGTSAVGGLVGRQNGGSVSASFWDTTGQADGWGGGTGDTFDATGLTTADFWNTATFMALARAKGWDFQSVWAPPSMGYYPVQYGMERVVFADPSHQRRYGETSQVARYYGLRPGEFLTAAATLTNSPGGTAAVGDYTVTADITNAVATRSYRFITAPGTVSVTARAIVVTANDLARHYGDANPALTSGIGGDGLASFHGDLAAMGLGLTTTASQTSDVGGYSIDLTGVNGNYVVTFNAGTLTVTPRAITVRADDLARHYGEANSGLSFTVGAMGLVNSDSLSGTLATAAGTASNVGGYAITQGTLTNAANPNYAITYTGGTLTVTPRAITVRADDLRKLLGRADPALTWTITGGSLASFDTAAAVFSGLLLRDPGEFPGSYGIGQGTLAANANYALSFLDGMLTVEPVTVTAARLLERSLPLVSPPEPNEAERLALCDRGVLSEIDCAAYTHPANRDLDHVGFAQ